MAKNIVIYSDGTGQAGGLRPEQRLSNIYKMYRASKVSTENGISPNEQVAFYDPGLGSGEAESFLLHPLRTINKLLSSALGAGLNVNIADCYEAILKYYEPGDRIYLFGFSRGAYTARCVANVMNLCGIPQHDENGNPIPRHGKKLRKIAEEAVFNVYEHGASKDRKKYEQEREELARRFRKKYGSEGVGRHGEPQGNIQPYFVGVFDTVAALGLSTWRKVAFLLIPHLLFVFLLGYFLSTDAWPTWGIMLLLTYILSVAYSYKSRLRYIRDFPNRGDFKWHFKSWGLSHYDRYLDNLVPFARHAISIDESRCDFPKVGWGKQADFDVTRDQHPAWMKQVWFAGNHSDIGGSYPEDESRLSDIALQWMLDEIREVPHPVIFNQNLLNVFPQPHAVQHCEVEALKELLWPSWWPEQYRFSWPAEVRHITDAAELHDSVIERFRCTTVCRHGHTTPYRPEALRNHKRVKDFYAGDCKQQA